MKISLCGLCVAFLLVPVGVQSQVIDVSKVLLQARGKVVHLMVKGNEAAGENFEQPIHGSGVIIRTGASEPSRKFRILTAAHVVKPDSAWAPLGARVNRDVYVIAEYGSGTLEYRPVTGVVVNNGKDIAQVVAGPRTSIAADLKPGPLVAEKNYVVVSWGLDGDVVAENATAKLVKALGPDATDPDLVKLEGELVPTESGSPVLDETGAVVAIVVMREVSGSDSHVAFALPIGKVADWITGVQTNPVVEPGQQKIQAVSQAKGLCVFLGKKSALSRVELNYPDAPYGRKLLEQIQEKASSNPAISSFTLFEAPLRIDPKTGAINIRSRCPEIRDGKAFYGSSVAQLTTASQVRVGNIQPLRYLDDTFYWATVTEIVATR